MYLVAGIFCVLNLRQKEVGVHDEALKNQECGLSDAKKLYEKETGADIPLQVVLSDVFTGISCTVGISLFSDLRY